VHPILKACRSFTTCAFLSAICVLVEPDIAVGKSIVEDPKPAFDLSVKTDKQFEQYSLDLFSLRQAIVANDLGTVSRLLEQLKHTKQPSVLYEVAKVRLDRNSPFYDPSAGIGLIDRIYSSGNARLAGRAALLAGLHYKKTRDRTKTGLAIDWLNKAASLNLHKAHIHLGDLYSVDIPDQLNLEMALHHYEEAARQDSVSPLISFARKVAQLVANGTECSINPFVIADEYLPKLFAEATQGKTSAAKELGRLYLQGTFVPKDPELASKWLWRAVKQGDTSALRDVAKIHLQKTDSSASHARAIKLLKISGSKGNGAAYATLAGIYLSQNKTRSDKLALEMYQKSVNAGYYDGLKQLRKVYDGEVLLGRHPGRIKRLSSIIDKLTSRVAGYQPPTRTGGSELVLGASDIDTVIVGSVATSNTSSGIEGYLTGSCAVADNFWSEGIRTPNN